ncbi:DUF2523 family protein [Vibrio lentus]|uniref:DUF2523 family protein n=1 Tax=Vibrio lentus TaxID=136468 RepID=UPI000C82DC22|nr:DUF2523 family protein [Vibrio lentus]PMM24923.1 hypothetical protein BCT58_11690 [Vibrio lentus]
MLDWFAERWNNAVNFCWSLWLSLYDLLTDIALFVFDGILSVSLLAIDGIGSSFSALNVIQYIDLIPNEVKSIMALVGVNEASVIIVSAILIRLGLQLVPFTRLGS